MAAPEGIEDESRKAGALSVVVVTHEHADVVGRTLPPLLAELGPGDELIVVDNASADGTAQAVRAAAPGALLVESAENAGFAAAANLGAERARGDVLLFLNPDALVAPGFGTAIRRPLEEGRGWAAWMGLVTMDEGRLVNTLGGVVHFTGISWSGGVGEPVAAAGEAREVPFVSGACLAIPAMEWRRAGGFPPDFFLYCEDVDLSLRLRLAGGQLGIEPAARADHDYSFAKGAYKWRLLERNRWAVLVRTYPAALLAAVAPALVLTELALLPVAVAGGWGREKLAAWGETLRALPRLLRERRAVQAGRAASAAEFAAWLTPDLSSPDLGPLAGNRLLRAALRTYWRLALAAVGGQDRHQR